MGISVPLLLRGPATVGKLGAARLRDPGTRPLSQIAALHAGDRLTGRAIAEGLRERGFSAPRQAAPPPATTGEDRPTRYVSPPWRAKPRAMLAAANGPRIAAMEISGWDTHQAQVNRLGSRCGNWMPGWRR